MVDLEGVINTKIIAHPLNWIVVLLMVLIAAMGTEQVIKLFTSRVKLSNGSATP